MRLLSVCTLLISFLGVRGQSHSFEVAAGPGHALIGGSRFKYYFHNGIGGAVTFSYNTTKLGAVRLTYRYLNFKKKSIQPHSFSMSMITGGYRTFFLNSKLYVFGEAGIRVRKTEVSNLVLTTGVGYAINLSKRSWIDISPSYLCLFGGSAFRMTVLSNVSFRCRLGSQK